MIAAPLPGFHRDGPVKPHRLVRFIASKRRQVVEPDKTAATTGAWPSAPDRSAPFHPLPEIAPICHAQRDESAPEQQTAANKGAGPLPVTVLTAVRVLCLTTADLSAANRARRGQLRSLEVSAAEPPQRLSCACVGAGSGEPVATRPFCPVRRTSGAPST